jgi:hypothetical protein
MGLVPRSPRTAPHGSRPESGVASFRDEQPSAITGRVMRTHRAHAGGGAACRQDNCRFPQSLNRQIATIEDGAHQWQTGEAKDENAAPKRPARGEIRAWERSP